MVHDPERRGFFHQLPATLPKAEPLIWLSELQAPVCQQNPRLRSFVPHLPCWIPQRTIADALGFSHAGIDHALERLGRPWLWATELENVHSVWRYDEPSITVDGRQYECSEDYYPAQKPRPFDAELWDARRDDVMRVALRHKLAARPALGALLQATAGHPLLSIKNDSYWGVLPSGSGENRLAALWMALRAAPGLAPSGSAASHTSHPR